MNKSLRNSVIVAYVILVSISFVSCNKTSEIKKKETKTIQADQNLAHNVNEKVAFRNPIVFITGYDKGNQIFYKNARAYFKEKNMTL
ncbi:hypothetical protein [Polaribacter ponticola]|uniref:Uncharacterized protein n=1 Tax=Polaribacter ponticola TaxID=2978475 RepID=A0ABT5S8J1_9FLAO|nr:hypothetical protein [Polaribacter sp. MSW5]MDD7913905.1 hypothetical protein [Polaribacter sp. MSW5]